MTARLSVQGLECRFGGRLVVTADFEVAPGEVVALVGPNGAGKTTVLKCVVGTLTPSAGTIRLDGAKLDERDPAVRAALAAVLDDMGWFPDVTCAEHLDLLARAHGAADPESVADQAMATLRISHVADQIPATLSSGQRRRLALATTLVRKASLVVLDEPEQRLDVEGRQWLADHIRTIARDGAGVLLACHDFDLLDAMGARRVELANRDIDT